MLVSGQTVPRKGSFFQSEGAEISCAERDPTRKGSFFQSGGLNFLVPHGTAPRKGRFSRTVGGDEENVFKKQSQLFNFPQFLRFFSISFTIEFVELLVAYQT